MKRTLISKILIGYFCVGLMGFFVVTILCYKINYNNVLDERAQAMYEDAIRIANDTMQSFYNVDDSMSQSDLERELSGIARYTDTRVIVINSEYDVLVDTSKTSGETTIAKISEFDPLETGKKVYQTGNFYNYIDEQVISVKTTINYGFSVRGYVTVHYEIEKLQEEANSRNVVCYITYLIIYVLSFIIFGIFYFQVHKPIKGILEGTKEFEKGNLKHKIKIQDPDDEIGRLSASFNYVANEIDEIEDFQKKFIANVSHDFRSPLTSIKGYIEAMMDGTIPVELQEKYFKIVISETERLNKLTNSMLALNDMNTRGVHLTITEFAITEVIRRTIETFGGICRGKNIQFNLTFSSKDLYVKGDVDKIQQVVYNLVDNAIKFSNNDSIIAISATEKNDRVYVSVKDSGMGIPKEDIPKIWDRFYKSDLSRGKDKKGTGLGLCIVKEIIQAHHTNIDVVSTVSVGTEFIFYLPVVDKEKDAD